ncbi:MAG: hypothetical protein A2Z20_00325 [Bdellovibrionales bacterium RBG_16_40_8]|nr:MAG: hypothetical protein A2Z20_00325 [Bdellovibrionales bacterium RBG_16_40_8]
MWFCFFKRQLYGFRIGLNMGFVGNTESTRWAAVSAMLLTSNRDVEEWPQVFSDPVLANAAIDRMFEAANICVFEGESYRMKG